MANRQNQKNSNPKNRAANNQPGSGSAYHREHANNVPDYGANSMDPNAEKFQE